MIPCIFALQSEFRQESVGGCSRPLPASVLVWPTTSTCFPRSAFAPQLHGRPGDAQFAGDVLALNSIACPQDDLGSPHQKV